LPLHKNGALDAWLASATWTTRERMATGTYEVAVRLKGTDRHSGISTGVISMIRSLEAHANRGDLCLSAHPLDKPSVTDVGRHSEHFHAPLTTSIDLPGWHVLMTRTNAPLQDSAPLCQIGFGKDQRGTHSMSYPSAYIA
jgi:hypothetical protein